MKVERGMQVGKLRMELSIQSLDVESHSVMSENHEFFASITNRVRQFAEDLLRSEVPTLPPKKGQTA